MLKTLAMSVLRWTGRQLQLIVKVLNWQGISVLDNNFQREKITCVFLKPLGLGL